ncbi:hypothetical protein [Sphingomonas adhaesiva]|uniref:hypothetical protein n=1 Tax=Sphingomonas adhaesiva TaxID=28212 RepID=UPI002FFC68EB
MEMRRHGWPLALIAAALAALAIGWIGYIASDDALYYRGALRWLVDPPFAGANHWATRFPLTLTFAGMIALLGKGYAAFAATALLFYLALVVVTGVFARRVAGTRAGWIAAILTATLPVIVSNATTVSVDLLEASALMLGILLLTRGGDVMALAGGTCFGVAILCRETSVLPLAGLAPLFLLGRPVPRRALVLAGIGCALVLGVEAAFQYALTGDPLRRYAIAFHHDEHIDRAANREGNVLLWPPIDPLLVLLVNDDFGVLFWLLPAALAARAVPPQGRGRMTVLGAMALAAFLLVAVLVHKLVLNPRYFTLPALAAVIVVAAWLARRRWGPLMLAGMVAANLLLLSAANVHPRWTMEALVAASAAYPHETIAADRHNVLIARESMQFAGRSNIRSGRTGLVIAEVDAAPRGTIVARYPSPPTRLGAAVRALGLESLVPGAIARRMFRPNADVVLVRTSG